MSIYAKLAKARVDMQSINISKSGLNKFANFKYFELQDLMPHINKVMHDNGLCGVVSFAVDGVAQLTIHETDGDGMASFYSPTADATVKGATPIQCLGSMHTYLRRYLWMLALEIVEHDAIDAQPTEKETTKAIKEAPPEPEKPWYNELETHKQKMIADIKSGKTTDQILATLRRKYRVSKAIAEQIESLGDVA